MLGDQRLLEAQGDLGPMQSWFNGETSCPIYQSESGLEVSQHNGKKVLINPEVGGWAVVSRQELIEMLNPSGFLSPAMGEKAYEHGLARKNGHRVFDPGAQTDKLFFFEFSVADVCNLACIYCSAGTVPAKQIPRTDPRVGRKFVDRIVEYCTANGVRQVEIEFTGGEPLANVDFLSQTIDYAMERTAAHDIRAKFLLISNLTLIGKRQLEFLERYKIMINASLDGDEEAHNAHRPFAAGRGSYHAVAKNLEKLKERGLEPHAIQSVITCRTVEKMPEIAKLLMDLGFTRIVLQPMMFGGILCQDPHKYLPRPARYVEKLFETFETVHIPFWEKTGIMPHTRYLGLTYAYLLEPKRVYMCQRSPCGAGRTIIAVKPDGDVYGCATGPWNEDFYYGNIFRDSFEDCRRSQNACRSGERHFRTIEQCSSCLYRGWCQSGCPKDAYAVHKALMAPSGLCGLYKRLWRRALETLVDETYPEEAVRAVASSYLK